jgi:Calx-beta domain
MKNQRNRSRIRISLALVLVGLMSTMALPGYSQNRSLRANGIKQPAAANPNRSPVSRGISSAGAKSILIYGPSLDTTADPNEQSLAQAAGYTVTVVDEATWSGMTTAQFAAFDAIVFADPSCGSADTVATANATKSVWSRAITGPVYIQGTDPIFHEFPGGQIMVGDGIAFATSGPGTGLYASLSCYYAGAPPDTPLDFLSEIGDFKVSAAESEAGCVDTVTIMAPSHPAMAGLTDGMLSDWECSVHEFITSAPSAFELLATGLRDDGAKVAYVIASTPRPNTVQFSSASYSVSEGSPRVDITLSRSGDTTGEATVRYATNDEAGLQNCDMVNGKASPRCDYETTIGTVQFAAGETSKSFSIAIVDDSYAEGDETFTVSLTGASGATLASQTVASVTIIDNDSANGADPIDDTNFFVRQQYVDFLGREPDPPGFAGWVSTINNCSGDTTQCDRVRVSEAFFRSQEFQERGYFTYRFYSVGLGRKPDYAEFVPDLARVSGFLDASQLEAAKVHFVSDFMARPAFVAKYTGLSNSEYVNALCQTADVTLPNQQDLIDSLDNNTASRAQVLRKIVESGEVSARYFNQSFAVMEYFGYLRRDPDAMYLNWIDVLNQGGDSRGMVDGFVNSTEYRLRFGP